MSNPFQLPRRQPDAPVGRGVSAPHRAQRQAAAYTLAPASSEPSEPEEPRKPKRDWLAPKPRDWLAVT
jgi:hypothetical protein